MSDPRPTLRAHKRTKYLQHELLIPSFQWWNKRKYTRIKNTWFTFTFADTEFYLKLWKTSLLFACQDNTRSPTECVNIPWSANELKPRSSFSSSIFTHVCHFPDPETSRYFNFLRLLKFLSYVSCYICLSPFCQSLVHILCARQNIDYLFRGMTVFREIK